MSNCSDSIPLQNKFVQGEVISLAAIDQPGRIRSGSNYYTYYNYNGVYDWLRSGTNIYFFQCPFAVLSAFNIGITSADNMIGFNLHMYNNGNNFLINAPTPPTSIEYVEHGGDGDTIIVTTTTDLPPPMINDEDDSSQSNYHFAITDCGDVILVDYGNNNIPAWTRIKVQNQGDINVIVGIDTNSSWQY